MSDDGQGRTLLATPVPSTNPPESDGEEVKLTEPASDSLIGKELAGRYKIDRKLGEGGMGSVYIATHTTLEKLVAIKILHGEYARKADLIERFLQEAKAASKIRHENVIDITDFGTTPDGLVFFCMELLAGQDLHELLTRARIEGETLSWSRTAPIFLQICAALDAAHAVGVIHRDLKPENIFLIDWLGNPDFVKLLDFGIAKVQSVEGSEDGRKLTKTGMLFGTPEYMSPEQARGDKPDARVDVYAMGCILFQLITGRVPFSGDSFMAVLSQHLTAEPPRVTPEELAAVGAPAALADVIARSLLKDRDERHGSIKELADAVRQVCAGMPLAMPNPTGTHQIPTAVARQAETTGQQAVPEKVSRKSEWTGSARVQAQSAPTIKPDDKTKRTAKLLWMAVAGVVVVGGAAVAAIALGGGAGGGDSSGEVDQPDQPAITAPDPGETTPDTTQPDPPPTPTEDKPVEAKTPTEDKPVEAKTPTEDKPVEAKTPTETVETKPPVEDKPIKKTCPADQRWSAAKGKCVANKVQTTTETTTETGEPKIKDPFKDQQ